MKRIAILTCIAVAIAAIGGLTWVLLWRDAPAKTLARAKLALRADQPHKALRLAQEYQSRAPRDWQGYMVQGMAWMHLGEHARARRVLEHAVQLGPTDSSASIALAKTYVLPALRPIESPTEAPLSELEAAVAEIQKAEEVLLSARPAGPIDALALKQTAACNKACMARISRMIVEKLAADLQMAEAGHATERLEEIRRRYQEASGRSQSLERQAVESLMQVLAEGRGLLAGAGGQRRRDVAQHADTAARQLARLCIDFNRTDDWPAIRAAIEACEDASPVAVALATVHNARCRRFAGTAQRRREILKGCQRVDGLLQNGSMPAEDRKEVLLARAALALAAGDIAAAGHACRQALGIAARDPMARLLLAETMLARKQFAEAERALFLLRAELPHSPEVAFAYARAADALGKDQLARGAMQAAIELDARHAGASKCLIEAYLREGYREEAYIQARRFHASNTGQAEALRLLVETARATGRQAVAEEALAQAVANFADRPEVLVAAAEAYALLGDQRRSSQAAHKAAAAEPTDAASKAAVARALVLSGRADQAEYMLELHLADDPACAEVQFELARLYAATARPLQAADRLQRALESDPDSYPIRLALAETLLKLRSLRLCGEVLEALPARDPKANFLRLHLGILEGRPVRAAEALAVSSAAMLSPRGLAEAFLATGEPAKCLEICLNELEDPAADVEWRFLAAEAELAMNQPARYREHLAAAVAAAPDRLDVYVRLAGALAGSEPADRLHKTLAGTRGARSELARLAAAAALNEMGQNDKAARLCRDLLNRREAPTWTTDRARLMLARSLAAAGRTQSALAELDAFGHEERTSAEVMLEKARILAEANRTDEAMEVLAGLAVAARRRRDAALTARVIAIYAACGQGDAAIACCEGLGQGPAAVRQGNLIKADLHRAAGWPDLAADCYRGIIAAFPNDLAPRLALAEALNEALRPIEALGVLDEAQAIGPAGRLQAGLAKANLLARWRLDEQASVCLAKLEPLPLGDSPLTDLALGRAYAAIGKPDKAREHLLRIPDFTPEHLPGRLALAALAPTPEESLAALDGLEAAYPGSDAVLEAVLSVLLRSGRTRQCSERFQQFVKDHCHRRLPERAALVALPAMLEAGDEDTAWELCGRLAAQTHKPSWRRLARLLVPQASAAEPAAVEPGQAADILIEIVNASRAGDEARLRRLTDSLQAIAGADNTCPPQHRVLASLIADGPSDPRAIARALASGHLAGTPLEALAPRQPAEEARKILAGLPPGTLNGTLRAAAMALVSVDDRQRQRRQATELLRASLALDMGLAPLAHRLATDLLSADSECQWAAVLAASARGDAENLRSILSTLKPPQCAVAAAIEGELLMKEGRFQQSAEAFGRAASLAGDSPDLRLRAAGALENAGESDEALKLYVQTLAGARGDVAAVAANNAAYLVARLWPDDKPRLLEADRWSAKAVETCPHVPTFHDTRGWIAHLLGRTDEACRHLRTALAGESGSPELHAHLAEAEAAAGNHDLARWHRQAAERLTRKGADKPDSVAEARPGEAAARPL